MIRLKPFIAIVILVGTITNLSLPAAFSQDEISPLRVAVAANFAPAMEILRDHWSEKAGRPELQISVGSTGTLFGQIKHGAGFDLFLAADAERPRLLVDAGLAESDSRMTYALGRLVVFSSSLDIQSTTLADIASLLFEYFAIADPDVAPYGVAAKEALMQAGVWDALQDRIVYGRDISQVWQYLGSGAAEIGLLSLSQVTLVDLPASASYMEVDHGYYQPLRQQVVMMTGCKSPATAREFLNFLQQKSTQDLIIAAGYGVETSTVSDDLRNVTASAFEGSLQAIWLTMKLASVTTFILLLFGTPLAWWLSGDGGLFKVVIRTATAMPLVLPPTVLGFYLLILLGPHGPVGSLWESLGGDRLVFSFSGLVIGSALYSLPFVVQPLQNAFEALGTAPLEAAATLRAGPLDRFMTVVFPITRPAFVTAAVLGFAHTVGEFGVVLMIGGNIPGRTQVLSVAIFNHVEALRYAQAHWLAGGMLLFAFLLLVLIYSSDKRRKSLLL